MTAGGAREAIRSARVSEKGGPRSEMAGLLAIALIYQDASEVAAR
jgi:hypothetical protein